MPGNWSCGFFNADNHEIDENWIGEYLDYQWHGSIPGLSILSMTWECTWIVNDMGVYLDCQ